MERFRKTTVANKLAARFEAAYRECSSPDRELAARARGTQAAIEYISIGFGFGVLQSLTCSRFMQEDGVTPSRLTKTTLYKAVLSRVAALPGFYRGNGYDQVTGKGEEANEQYGEWRYLLDIADEYSQ